ncbi:D-alanyl-D-alanine carboxypeptidase family protein [Arthrobacter cryoconiti]|uniref:D-alanyl-D-alanine carboxypeptidase family protein n=1 Tax=Arthrobacter cryoconiti TaxID=748907 RepID=A0ABV8QY29_9MICC|nr:hypothetical protein [Arthrobacter cryoconiti]MCC9068870.1 hypothetical protein [Arthrobacter cryoconiti]
MTPIRWRLLAFVAALTFCLTACSAPAVTQSKVLASSEITFTWPRASSSLTTLEDIAVEVSPEGRKSRPTASTAKVITALTVLTKFPLKAGEEGPELTVSAEDVQRYYDYAGRGGTYLLVYEGMLLTEREMLVAMMLPSANNIADSMAVWAFGSITSYATAASDYVKSLGMVSTHIGPDASGYDPATTSTAGDLALLARAAMKNPVIAEIAGQATTVIPGYGPVANTNSLLGQQGIVGLKTGTSPEAGGVFMFAANVSIKGRLTLVVGAVMGAGTTSADAIREASSLIQSIADSQPEESGSSGASQRG